MRPTEKVADCAADQSVTNHVFLRWCIAGLARLTLLLAILLGIALLRIVARTQRKQSDREQKREVFFHGLSNQIRGGVRRQVR